ncbi:hypothetical protein HA402_009459 [Bradysia odoriphaga]|nr:hypothetical protein HA402_009459 [Bradysia odoriphaga]
MSDISLKQSLELLEGIQKPKLKSGKQTKKSKNPFLREPSPPKVTLSSIIKSKKKTKQLSKPLTQSSRPKNTAAAVVNQMKQKPSKVEENLKKLLMFSSPVNLDNESAQKLFKRAQTQKYVIPEAKSNVEQETVFTDEDFRKFEREYFCS